MRFAATTYFLTRAFISLLGIGAIAWGAVLFPLFREQAPLNRMAADILQGHKYGTPTLLDEIRQVEAERSSSCNPIGLHDAVVLRLALLGNAVGVGSKTLFDSAYGPLYDATRRSLSCAPADPFAWLILFWLDTSKHGLNEDNATYLRLSYALGPNEGWIALRRNRLAIALFAQLPADLADDAIGEFVRLVDTGALYRQTVAIFANAAPAVQRRLVERLKFAEPIPRRIFARILYDKGFDIDVPDFRKPSHSWE